MCTIAALFWTIAGTSIAIGWSAVGPYSWQHFFAIGALCVSVAVLVWLHVLRQREVRRLASPPMREGATGKDVAWVQRRLEAEQLYRGKVDGWFGPKTDHAVRSFQARNDLEQDGVVGLMTMILLDEKDSSPHAPRAKRLTRIGSQRRDSEG